MSDARIVDNLETVWGTIDTLCGPLAEEQWHLPTGCPNWTVKDIVAHIAGTESFMLGEPAPDHRAPLSGTLPNQIAERNEVLVDFRRSWPGTQVLNDFRRVTTERVRVLRAMSKDDFSRRSWTPAGPGTYRDLLQMRIFDCFVHEQDIRHAIGQPGNLDGFLANHALRSTVSFLVRTLGGTLQLPADTTVVIDITGPTATTINLVSHDGALKPLPAPPGNPTSGLTMDFTTFALLSWGRMTPDMALGANRVGLKGDASVGHSVLEHLNILF